MTFPKSKVGYTFFFFFFLSLGEGGVFFVCHMGRLGYDRREDPCRMFYSVETLSRDN